MDVLHSLASIAPVRAPVPAVITLHDVTFILRRTFGRVTTVGMSTIISRAARNADGLLVGERGGAGRGSRPSCWGWTPARSWSCRTAPAACPAWSGPSLSTSVPSYRLGDARLVLCVGAERRHKNQELLLRALPELPGDTVVALVGHAEPYDRDLRRLAAEQGLSERVRFLDYVPDAELESLLRVWRHAWPFPPLARASGCR